MYELLFVGMLFLFYIVALVDEAPDKKDKEKKK